MPLPKISTPTYELELPSTGKSIKYRPFLVKEEKILILALESQDIKQITLAIKQVLKDCIITKGIKIEDLPSFDIEYIFLNVRGKSVGEAIDLVVTCSDDGTTEVPVKVYVDEIKGAVISAAQAAGAGNLPAGVKRLLKDITAPVIGWKELLQQQNSTGYGS